MKVNRSTCPIVLTLAFMLGSAAALAAQPGRPMTLPAASRIVVELGNTLESSESKENDEITATLAADLTVDGQVVARRGDLLKGHVVEAKKGGRVVRRAGLSFTFSELAVGGRRYIAQTDTFDLEGERTGDVKKIARKVALGAVLGGAELATRMAKSGSVVAVITPGKQLQVPKGAILELYLTNPLEILSQTEVLALDRQQVITQMLMARQANLAKLRTYSWTSEMTIFIEDEEKGTSRFHVKFDAAGGVQRTPILTGDEDKKRGIRGKIVEKKQEEIQELLGAAGKMLASYVVMRPEQLTPLISAGPASLSERPMEGAIQFSGIDVVQPGDWVAMWIDKDDYHVRHLMVSTELDGEALQADIEYETAPAGGPHHESVITARLLGHKLESVTRNSDYVSG